jgi:hypothetical protein
VPVQYRVDGGPLGRKPDGTIVLDNAVGVTRAQAMYQVWQGGIDAPGTQSGH